MRSALVVGAGVIGLSCAIRLREAGVDANVVAEHTGRATTSAAAAALWYPYRADPPSRVLGWSARTRVELERLAEDPATGVILRDGVQWVRDIPEGPPWWADAVGDLRALGASGPWAAGWGFRAPVADTARYLGWLTHRLGTLGGTVRTGRVGTVADVRDRADVVVLATGVGARTLPGDPSVTPIRGQVVRVHAPDVRTWTLDEHHPDGIVYVIPRVDDVVCGGVDEPDAGSPDPHPLTAARILARCRTVEPRLATAGSVTVLGHAVGWRPVRPTVRVQRDAHDPGLVYCYGHGGAGVTLSWGCADEVTELLA